MKRMLAGCFVVFIGIALCVKSPDASSVHFVVANDGAVANAASVLDLSSLSNPTLTLDQTLPTGGNGETITLGLQETALAQQGAETCIYLTDASTADVAAFIYPSFDRVGRYKITGVKESEFSMGIAARGSFLFTAYTTNENIQFIATWNIGSGCILTLASTFVVPGSTQGMAVSPDGKTLIATYVSPLPSVDSFTIGSDGTLAEHGPYGGPFDTPTGVDITADSKYAIVGEIGGQPDDPTQVGIYEINADGSLGTYITYGGDGSLGPSSHTGYVWLSPNEKFLFVSGGGPDLPITTLNFNEDLQQVSYAGCAASTTGNATGLATAMPTGAGGALYVAEYGNNAGHKAKVALFSIDSSTGCLTQSAGSPYTTREEGSDFSVAA
jgi:6-phosphogluconolactonase (cycloisomerase 2 family)